MMHGQKNIKLCGY